MKSKVLRSPKVNMDYFYQKSSTFCRLILCICLGTTIPGCTTIAVSATALSTGIITTNSNLKFSVQRAFNKAKNWASNPKIRSSDKDLQFALQQFNHNKFAIAEFYFKKVLVKFPDNPTAIKRLPWTYFYQKRYDKALISFERIKTFYRKNHEPLIGMGWCYFGLKKYERAIEQFDRAEKLGGDFYQIHKGKAFANLKMNRYSHAKEEFSKIYSPSQIDNILTLWDDWHRTNADVLVDIIPPTPKVISLFSLPTEHPRYRSTLLGLPKNKDPAIELAWKAYRSGSFKKALDKFQDISLELQSPDVINGIAWTYLKNRDLKIASKIFKDILQTWPKFIGALKGIEEIEHIKRKQALHADYYFDMNKLKIAETKYEELQNEYPDWNYSHVQLGKVKLARDEYINAREYFLDALDLKPNDPTALIGIAEVRKKIDPSFFQADQALNSGDYKKAAIIYADYIEEQKLNISFFSKVLDKIKFTEAPWDEHKTPELNNSFISNFSRILEKLGLKDAKNRPTHPMVRSSGGSLAHAYNGLGWSQFYKKKYLQAAKKFEIARADREYFLESSRGLGLALYEAGEFKRAANALKPVVESQQDQLSLAYKMDMSILLSWDTAAAQKYFTENLVHYPLRASLYMGQGWLHYRNQNPDLGVEYFLKAISLDPKFALTEEFKTLLGKERFGWQVYNRFGWAYYEKQDYKNSLIMFQTSMKEQPNRSESRKGIGYTMSKIGKLAQAAKYLNQALAINPDPNPVAEMVSGNDAIAPYTITTTTRTTLGNIMLKQNNPFEAVAIFQRELELRPNLATALDGLGWAYLKLNRLTESRTAFKAAIKYQPLNNLSYKGLREVKQKIAAINMSSNSQNPIGQVSNIKTSNIYQK